MKINLKNNILAGKFVVLLLLASSCANNEDNFAEFPSASKPMVSATTTDFTVAEGGTISIPLTMEYVIDERVDLQILVTGGTATKFDDYEAGDSPLPIENGDPESGFIARFSPFSQTLDIPFTAFRDLMQTEGTETVKLNIKTTGLRTALTKDGGIDITITITDYQYCVWTLQVVDDYGDSWQGGTIVLTENGVDTVYPSEDWDDDEETYTIYIELGANFSFEYISGTTGTAPNQPGPPAYEEEDSYTLTAPDGTVYTGGVSPGDGVTTPDTGIIVSGTNSCN